MTEGGLKSVQGTREIEVSQGQMERWDWALSVEGLQLNFSQMLLMSKLSCDRKWNKGGTESKENAEKGKGILTVVI